MEYFQSIEWLSQHLLSCPFKSCTGLDCPGCGLQRSVIKLLEGDIPGSITMHPAGIPMIAMLLLLILHIKFDFKHGAKTLTILFIFSSVLSLINYIYKIYTGNLM